MLQIWARESETASSSPKTYHLRTHRFTIAVSKLTMSAHFFAPHKNYRIGSPPSPTSYTKIPFGAVNNKREWFSSSHVQRHYELNFGSTFDDALHGKKMLLIALAKPSRHASPPTVAIIDGETASSVFLYLKPCPQIGFKSHLLGFKYDLIKLDSNPNAPRYLCLNKLDRISTKDSLRRVNGIDGLTKRLDEMFREGVMFALASGAILWKMSVIDQYNVEKFCADDVPSVKKRKTREATGEDIGDECFILH